jgi:hypothetical protein
MSDFNIEKTLSSNYTSISKDMLEIGLDSILDDGLLKDIPAVGTLISLTKIGANIKDRLFIKKLIHFLYETQNIPKSDREEIIEKINESDDYKTKVGEKLIFIIDKADDLVKAQLIGKLFNAVLKKQLGYSMFIRCTEAINNTFEPDLMWFLKRVNPDSIEHIGGIEKESLINSGIMKAVSAEGATTMGSSSFDLKYDISDVGLCLKKYLGSYDVDYDDLIKDLKDDGSKNKW